MCSLKCSGEARHSSSPEKMSLQTEQETVREYCCRRKLHRPDTTVATAVIRLLAAESLGIAVAFITGILFRELDVFRRFSLYPPVWQFYFCGNVIAFAVCLRKLLITAVELYQRYAPEEIRRRCTLMPTCSEYAILALRKYGVIVGLYKIYVRLTKTCRGDGYRIDYP
ncbi:MAG: membrane protein insertion efficiency factor YidD [Prevotellaceae bacterium]|jgi:putative component of membrane protein insertase Oxa1/YidC/SpoIIIJ protein YidD|nr:membrane protein insertion efficiency factor YidD [Prevotellaceae bacterium]